MEIENKVLIRLINNSVCENVLTFKICDRHETLYVCFTRKKHICKLLLCFVPHVCTPYTTLYRNIIYIGVPITKRFYCACPSSFSIRSFERCTKNSPRGLMFITKSAIGNLRLLDSLRGAFGWRKKK